MIIKSFNLCIHSIISLCLFAQMAPLDSATRRPSDLTSKSCLCVFAFVLLCYCAFVCVYWKVCQLLVANGD